MLFISLLIWFCSKKRIILCLEIEIKSDATLAEAVKILARHNILSAPVVDVDAPEDASWIDRYIGIVEFAGIVVWILHQVRHMFQFIHQFNYLDNDPPPPPLKNWANDKVI